MSHVGVVYEDGVGNHLSKKHVAEKAEEQAAVNFPVQRNTEHELLTNR